MENKEEYKILFKIKESKNYDFNSSSKKGIHHIINKKLVIFLILSIIIFVLITSLKLIFKIDPHDQIGLINNNNITKFLFREAFPDISLPIETYTSIVNGKNITYLTKEMVDKFNLFINNCINDTLIDKEKYPLVENPKISAIMPIYNGGKYLHYSLRSIQNQKMKDIEIILIDDCSTDNTLTIIEKYMKEDERIRLIKNFENRKILYSKSIGVLNSKGKYIIELDQDDIFIRDDVFDILYHEAEKDNYFLQ